MENQLVPNIDKIHEEIDSENWEKILLAVGRFVEGVKAELGGNGFGYLQCLKSLSISFDDIPEQTTGADELAWVTADMILGRFNYEKFRLTVGSFGEIDFYSSHYALYFGLLLSQFSVFLKFSKENVKIINDHIEILARRKISSSKVDRWGAFDDSKWISVASEFASEKLIGSSFLALSEKTSDIVINYARLCKVDNFGGRFVDAVVEHEMSQRGGPSIVSGEDFEYHIKNMIEANIPGVVVETTPRTGDNGADLLVFASDYTIAIQAKYYSSPVGNSAVQEIFSAKSLYKADFAVVVTNSTYTKPAQEAAEALKVILASEDSIIEIIKFIID